MVFHFDILIVVDYLFHVIMLFLHQVILIYVVVLYEKIHELQFFGFHELNGNLVI